MLRRQSMLAPVLPQRSPLRCLPLLGALIALTACTAPAPTAVGTLQIRSQSTQSFVLTSSQTVEVHSTTNDIRLDRQEDVLFVTANGNGTLIFDVDGQATFEVRVESVAPSTNANATLPASVCHHTMCMRTATTLGGTVMFAIEPDLGDDAITLAPKATARRALTDAQYPLVFPFFGLELLGETLQSDTVDLTPNLDAVNALAYERHHIQDGEFIVRHPITSDPRDYANTHGLAAWPMISHDRPISEADIASLYAARQTIIDDAVSIAVARDYAGYILDVEVAFQNPTTARNQYMGFVTELTAALHAANKKLMVATARWINLAPIATLAATDVDYIASMDPMHPGGESMWLQKMPPTYADVGNPARLVWVFSWDFFRDAAGRNEQLAQFQWMEDNGYNDGIAGASCFRTPMAVPNAYHSIDYYEAFRQHYPAAAPGTVPAPTGTVRGIVWDLDVTPEASQATAMGALLPEATIACDLCESDVIVDDTTAAWRLDLPPGTYVLTASADGYADTTREVTVTASTTTWSSLGLRPVADVDAGPFDGGLGDGGLGDGGLGDGGLGEESDAGARDGGPAAEIDAGNQRVDAGTVDPGDDAGETLPPSLQPRCECATSPTGGPGAAFALLFGCAFVVVRRRNAAR